MFFQGGMRIGSDRQLSLQSSPVNAASLLIAAVSGAKVIVDFLSIF